MSADCQSEFPIISGNAPRNQKSTNFDYLLGGLAATSDIGTFPSIVDHYFDDDVRRKFGGSRAVIQTDMIRLAIDKSDSWQRMSTPPVLKIASHPGWYPESGECSLDGFGRRKNCKMPGYGPEVLDMILSYMKIPYEIVKLPADAFGGEMVNANDTVWNGILKDLQNGAYDTISAPYIITEERSASFDFSFPINSLETIFVVGPDQPDFLGSSFRLFLIFDPTLTIAVITVLFTLIIGVFFSQTFYRKRTYQKVPILLTIDDQLLRHQYTTSGKTFALFLGFGLLIFTGLYEGCLLTYLLLPPRESTMSENQLLNRVSAKKLTFVTDEDHYNGYGTWQLVRFSKLDKYLKFQDTIKHNPPLFTNIDTISLSALFEAHPTEFVYYGDSGALMFAKSQCSLQVVAMTDPDILRSGFIFRKNSSLVNKFNEAINRNWNFVQSVRERYLSIDRSNCTRTQQSTQVVPLTLITLLGCYTLLSIGFSLAALAFLMESLLCTGSFVTSSRFRLANFVNNKHAFQEQQLQSKKTISLLNSSHYQEVHVKSNGTHQSDPNIVSLSAFIDENNRVMPVGALCRTKSTEVPWWPVDNALGRTKSAEVPWWPVDNNSTNNPLSYQCMLHYQS